MRLRYATDAAFEERGWFADDISVTADGTEVWADDTESGENGWTAEVRSFTNTRGAGWVLTSGTIDYARDGRPAIEGGTRAPQPTSHWAHRCVGPTQPEQHPGRADGPTGPSRGGVDGE